MPKHKNCGGLCSRLGFVVVVFAISAYSMPMNSLVRPSPFLYICFLKPSLQRQIYPNHTPTPNSPLPKSIAGTDNSPTSQRLTDSLPTKQAFCVHCLLIPFPLPSHNLPLPSSLPFPPFVLLTQRLGSRLPPPPPAPQPPHIRVHQGVGKRTNQQVSSSSGCWKEDQPAGAEFIRVSE